MEEVFFEKDDDDDDNRVPEYGCKSNIECSVCFKPLCGARQAELCDACIPTLSERDEQGRVINPANRLPVRMCVCGKPWNMDCADHGVNGRDVRFGNGQLTTVLTDDTVRNRALLFDPANYLPYDNTRHALVPIK